jgi:hypothetical protein
MILDMEINRSLQFEELILLFRILLKIFVQLKLD